MTILRGNAKLIPTAFRPVPAERPFESSYRITVNLDWIVDTDARHHEFERTFVLVDRSRRTAVTLQMLQVSLHSLYN